MWVCTHVILCCNVIHIYYAGQQLLQASPTLVPAEARAAAEGAGKADALAQSQASASTLRCIYPPCNSILTPADCCGPSNGPAISAGSCGCFG